MSSRIGSQIPESCTQRAILDYLTACHVLAFRMNTGAVKLGNRVVRFGVKGMGDILAFPKERTLWIEVKTDKGKQSPFQKSFEEQVIEAGHEYIVARSVEDVAKALGMETR